MRTVEAAVAVGVAPFCAKTSPKAASPRIINAATIMTTKRIWCSLSAQAVVHVDHIQKKFRDDDYGGHGRFPPPWSIEETEACLIVRDANRQALAYVYFEKEPRRRFRRDELLTRDEAQRIAAIFAKLPELLHRASAN